MLPVLIDIPGLFTLRTYGVLVALGFFTGIVLSLREARRTGEDPELIFDLSFWILISAMVGSRVLFIITRWEDYLADPMAVLRFWQGGLVFYGGFIGAVAASWYFMAKHHLPFFKVADIMIPGVAIGHALGRMGCFSAGCCWGKEAGDHYPLAAIFTDPAAHLPHNVPLHPVQLYESFGELAIFFTLITLRTNKRFHGQILLAYLFLYSVLRSITELYRGDSIRGFVIEDVLSTSQFISILVAAAALALTAYFWRRAGREPAAAAV